VSTAAGLEARKLLHALVLDDGRLWGAAATPWQIADAQAILDPGPDDPTLHWIGRPKGGSKSTDLAGLSIAWLVEQAPALAEGYAAAADRDQAARLLRKAAGFIRRTEGLGAHLEVQQNRILHKASGAFVEALAADVAGSEGLLSPWFVVDELANWANTTTAKGMWTSLFSGVEKWPGCRLTVITHAGDPAHWSRRVLDDALPELGWRVHEVPGPLPWITEAGLERQRRSLLPSQFARRHLNQWATAEDRLTVAEDVDACMVLDGPQDPWPDRLYLTSLDVGLTRDACVAMVCSVPRWFEGRPTVRLDRLAVWQGTREAPVSLDAVEGWLLQAWRDFGAGVLADPYQAQHILQRLAVRGVPAVPYAFTQQSISRLAVGLFNALRDRALELPVDEGLRDELVNVRLRETSPGVYRLDHDSDRHDDRAVTLALGVWGLLESDLLELQAGGDELDEDELEMLYGIENGISPI
jgi:hypothetical protein